MLKEWLFWKRNLKEQLTELSEKNDALQKKILHIQSLTEALCRTAEMQAQTADSQAKQLEALTQAYSEGHAGLLTLLQEYHTQSSQEYNGIEKRQSSLYTLATDLAKAQAEQSEALHTCCCQLKDEIGKIFDADTTSVQKVMNKLEAIHYWPNQNLKRRLYEVAGTTSAEFIIANMEKVPSFLNNKELLTYALSKVKNKNGLYAEFGVYTGGSINYIAQQIGTSTIYGFDSFEGLPEAWRTEFDKGAFKVDALPQVRDNVTLVKGFFDDSLPQFSEEHTAPFSFIHVDSDLYSSAKCIFDVLSPQIQTGCVIVFDEFFNYPGWQEGEYKAFMEFVEREQKDFEYIGYVETHEQVAVVIL